jgi:hypothetical protein
MRQISEVQIAASEVVHELCMRMRGYPGVRLTGPVLTAPVTTSFLSLQDAVFSEQLQGSILPADQSAFCWIVARQYMEIEEQSKESPDELYFDEDELFRESICAMTSTTGLTFDHKDYMSIAKALLDPSRPGVRIGLDGEMELWTLDGKSASRVRVNAAVRMLLDGSLEGVSIDGRITLRPYSPKTKDVREVTEAMFDILCERARAG